MADTLRRLGFHGPGQRGRADARRSPDRGALPRARGRGARGRGLGARRGRRRLARRHAHRAGGDRGDRRAPAGGAPLALLWSPGGAHRRPRARARRRGGDARRRPPGPARGHPGHARPLARRLRGRVRGARGPPGRDAVQAGDGALVLPAVPAARRRRPRARVRRLPPDGPAGAARAAGHARAQPLPARDDRVGRLHAVGRAVRPRGPQCRADEVHAVADAALRLRRDHVLLQPAAAVRHAARLLLLRSGVPGHPADDRRPLCGDLRARRADDDRHRPPAGGDPADHRGDHRRVRRAHLRRGQAPAALRGPRPRERGGARGGARGRAPAARIAGIGARAAGVVAAHRLTAAGHACDVYERWPGLGGQAATLDVGDGHRLERYYHHLFTTDRHIAGLFDELGLAEELEWRESTTAMLAHGRLWPFTTPGDLLRFRPLPPLDRVRMGAAAVLLQRFARRPQPYEGVTARDWISRRMGRAAWREVWGPIFRGKFGERADDIAMVWLWSKLRLRRGEDARDERLGYPRGSWEVLLEALRS